MFSYFGSDLVAALAGLDVDDLSHGCCSCCFGGGSCGNADPGPPAPEPWLGHVTPWLAGYWLSSDWSAAVNTGL